MRRTSALVVVCLVLVGSLGLAGCGHTDDRVHASATFDDVADLAVGAPVMMSDITIGKVQSIRLDPSGRRATVRFSVKRSAQVPADLIAQVRRTTPLGEKFIDLEPQTKSTRGPLLADGAVVRRTAVVSDVEQLVSSGTDTFSALSASQLAVLLDEGARAFGGKGPELNAILRRLSSVAAGYRTRTGKVVAIIDDLDRLSADLAPNTDQNGKALANVKATLGILNQNDERFYALVRSLDRLAHDGNRILGRYSDQITNQVRGLRDVTGAIADEDKALAGVLVNLPRHNQNVPLAERGNFINVLLDVVLCGVPGGGDVPGDPVDACYPGDSTSGGTK